MGSLNSIAINELPTMVVGTFLIARRDLGDFNENKNPGRQGRSGIR